MYNFENDMKRELVEAVLNRYHKTRLADDNVIDFILRGQQVQKKMDDLLRLYMTG